MAKELETSWFNLKNYEVFKTMSTEDWISQLFVRCVYHDFVVSRAIGIFEDGYPISNTVIAANLKVGLIPDEVIYHHEIYNSRAKKVLEGHSFSNTSVNSLTSFDLWSMIRNDVFNNVWEACQNYSNFILKDGFTEELVEIKKISHAPHDFNLKRYSYYKVSPSARVVIDLSATDEQIKNDFSHWLENFRQAINYTKKKNLFTQADFDYWVEYGVIQYLDLALIAKIEGRKITQNKLARMIFPDEYDVDIVERLRKVTKPAAEWLIKSNIYETLATQLTYEKVIGMKNT